MKNVLLFWEIVLLLGAVTTLGLCIRAHKVEASPDAAMYFVFTLGLVVVSLLLNTERRGL